MQKLLREENVAKVTQRITRLLLENAVNNECHAKFDQSRTNLTLCKFKGDNYSWFYFNATRQ